MSAPYTRLKAWGAPGQRYAAGSGGGGPTYTITLSGTVTPSGDLVKKPVKVFAGAMTPGGTLVKQPLKVLAGSVSIITGALVKKPLKVFGGTLSPTGSVVRSVSKTFAGTVASAGDVIKTPRRILSGLVDSAGTLARQVAVALHLPLDYAEIERILPHRYPFLLIDKVRDIVVGESCVGIKNVSMNEAIFQGHFPSDPVFPGVLVIEPRVFGDDRYLTAIQISSQARSAGAITGGEVVIVNGTGTVDGLAAAGASIFSQVSPGLW